SLLLGPGDHRQSSTEDVLRFLRGQIPFVPPGGISFVDARDAAAGAILAMEKGRPSRRYLLTAANWTMADFFRRLARSPAMRGAAGRGAAEGARRSPGWRAPELGPSVGMSRLFWNRARCRAGAKLGWDSPDPSETLEDTVAGL